MHPPQFGSGPKPGEMSQIQTIISGPSETDSTSFTALLGLPAPQAVELLISGEFQTNPMPPPIFPSNFSLIDRVSVYAAADKPPESQLVKQELSDSDWRPNSSSPAVSNQSSKSGMRKERGKKVNESNKRSKRVAANEASEASGEKLSFVHVRARSGQATDSHSLAERARREKINARMKLLQELVPGCNKISGTAMVLDEIINHVQALQRHVEFLSMRLAAVNTRVDFNLDEFIAAESGSSIDISYTGMFDPCMWGEGQMNDHKQQQPLTSSAIVRRHL